jgi:uncharacterized cupin superfamily protein
MHQVATQITKFSVVDAPVEPAPIPPEDIISGEPVSTMAILWRTDDGKLYNGVWHCTPGVFMLSSPGETITLIEGDVTITPEGGEPVTVRAGEIAYIPENTRAKWDVRETVRKGFHSYDSTGMLLGPA